MSPSKLEQTLAWQIKVTGLPEPVQEFVAIPDRRFRWDFAWPEQRLLLEVQGGVWKKGAHSGGTGVNRDTEKQNLAVLAGWRTLAVTTNQIRDGLAIAWLKKALERTHLTPD